MQKEKLDTTGYSLEKIIHTSLFAYLILLPFPHVTTLREIAFWTASFCWVVLRLKKQEPFITLNPIIASLSLFMVVAFISSVIGMEPFGNLRRFKGELLIPFLLFLIITTEYNSLEKIKKLLPPLVTAFAIYTMFVIIESFEWGFSYYWDETLRDHLTWLSGYAEMSITLLPLTLGYFLLIRTNLRFLLLFFMLLEFIIVAAYRNISSFGGTIFVILLGALFVQPKIYRLWIRAFIVIVMLISITLLYTHKDNPVIVEYKTKLYQITHPYEELKKTGGFKNRVPLWEAAIDVIKERPLIGYGWGMKKYTKIVAEEKYLNNWRIEKPEIYAVYTLYKGKFVPPHNLFLEITIQSGIIGLISFIAFIVIYLFYIIKTSIKFNSDADRNFSVIIVAGIIFSFLIANIMSNELGRLSGKVLFVVLGAGAAWMKDKTG